MTNDTGATLPPGILTLYDRTSGAASHVGDARLATLPAGEKRMLAFAVDRGIAVAREEQRRQTATSAKIARGVMTVTVLDRQTTTYRIRAAGAAGAHHPARASAAGRLAAGDARGRRRRTGARRLAHPGHDRCRRHHGRAGDDRAAAAAGGAAGECARCRDRRLCRCGRDRPRGARRAPAAGRTARGAGGADPARQGDRAGAGRPPPRNRSASAPTSRRCRRATRCTPASSTR